MMRRGEEAFAVSRRPPAKYVLIALIGIAACLGVFQFVHSGDTRYGRYVSGGSYEGAGPALSPDGRWVVYSSPRSGKGDLYEVRIDGTGTRRLTDTPDYEGEPCFFPDGKRIVYVAQLGGEESLWTLDLATLARTPIRGTRGCARPCLSPDGRLLACRHERRELNAVIVTPRMLDLATGHPVKAPGVDGQDFAWDRSGRHFFRVRGGAWDIRRANADGTGDRVIGQGRCPTPSPDGSRVAYLGGPYDQSLWIMGSDGTRAIQLYATRSNKAALSFTPDGRRLLFLDSAGHDDMHILLLDIRTRRTRVVASVL